MRKIRYPGTGTMQGTTARTVWRLSVRHGQSRLRLGGVRAFDTDLFSIEVSHGVGKGLETDFGIETAQLARPSFLQL